MCGRGSVGRVAIATRNQKSYKPQRKPGRREGARWLPDRHSQLTCWSVPDPAWTPLRLTPLQWNWRHGEGRASERDALSLNERWQRTEDTPGMRDRWSGFTEAHGGFSASNLDGWPQGREPLQRGFAWLHSKGQGGKLTLQGAVWGRVCSKGHYSNSHVRISILKYSNSDCSSLPGAQATP